MMHTLYAQRRFVLSSSVLVSIRAFPSEHHAQLSSIHQFNSTVRSTQNFANLGWKHVLVRTLEMLILLEVSQFLAQREIFQVVHRAAVRSRDLKATNHRHQTNKWKSSKSSDFSKDTRTSNIIVAMHYCWMHHRPVSLIQSRSCAGATRHLLRLPQWLLFLSHHDTKKIDDTYVFQWKQHNAPHPQKSFGNPKHRRNCAPDIDKIPPMYL